MKRNIKNFFAKLKRSPLILFIAILAWSLAIGWGGSLVLSSDSPATALDLAQANAPNNSATIGTVDPVTPRHQLGQDLYLQNCSTCHIAVPPGVLPTEAWAKLLQQEEHYGTKLEPLTRPSILIVWQYLQHFSRRLTQKEQENVPDRLQFSRYFKAFHPNVKFSQSIELGGCVTCHPGAPKFNFRTLTAEWENSP
jgi:mono/diheme cytochrome c family protein